MAAGRYVMKVDAFEYDASNPYELEDFVGKENVDSNGYPTEIWTGDDGTWKSVHGGDWVIRCADGSLDVIRERFESRFEAQ